MTCDAATTMTAFGYAAITLPGAPRLIAIAHDTVEELPDGTNVRGWLRAQSRADGVVIDTRKANELAFVHLEVLVKVPYELHNGSMWVELDQAIVDGPGGKNPQLLYAIGASL